MYNEWHKLQKRFQEDKPSMDLENAWVSLEKERSIHQAPSSNRKYYTIIIFALLVISAAIFWMNYESTDMINSSRSSDSISVKEEIHQTNFMHTIKNDNVSNDEYKSKEASNINSELRSNVLFKSNEKIFEKKDEQLKIEQYDASVKIENQITVTSGNETSYPKSSLLVKADAKKSKLNVPAFQSKSIFSTNQETKISEAIASNEGFSSPAKNESTTTSLLDKLGVNYLQLESAYNFPKATYNPTKRISSAIGISVSYGLNIRSLESLISYNDQWVDKRNQLEQAKDVYGIELFYQKFLTERFFISTGLNYTRWIDQLSYEYTEERMVSIDDVVVEIKYLSDGSIEEILGTVEAMESQDYFATVWQKQSELSVPILFGSHIALDRNSGISIAGGIQIPVYRSLDGKTIEKNNDFYGIEQIDPSSFKKSGPLQLLGDLRYFQSLGPSNRFQIGIKSQYDLTSRINEGEGISQKHFGFQLTTGLVKVF